jgi:hypothetical protein
MQTTWLSRVMARSAFFWGDRRFERAFCAGVTVKTFSQRHLEKRLEEKWPDLPAETGYKVVGRPPRRRGALNAPAVEADRQDAEMERLVGADHASQDRAWGQNL